MALQSPLRFGIFLLTLLLAGEVEAGRKNWGSLIATKPDDLIVCEDRISEVFCQFKRFVDDKKCRRAENLIHTALRDECQSIASDRRILQEITMGRLFKSACNRNLVTIKDCLPESGGNTRCLNRFIRKPQNLCRSAVAPSCGCSMDDIIKQASDSLCRKTKLMKYKGQVLPDNC